MLQSEEYRPKAVLPKHNLVVKEEKPKKSEKIDPPPPRPTSAMSNDFKPPGPEAFRKLFYLFLLSSVYHIVDNLHLFTVFRVATTKFEICSESSFIKR